MHYYKHHIGDFIKATARLSDSQAMAYLRLMWHYYDHDGLVFNDPKQISFEIGTDVELIEAIIKTFFYVDGDNIRHARCDKELKGYKNQIDGGKKGAESRWGKDKVSDGLPIATPMAAQCHPNANHKPITNNHSIGAVAPKTLKGKRFDLETIPEEWMTFCKTKRPDLNPVDVFEVFKDYWISVPGQKGVKLDWLATWRNWVKNQKQGNAKPAVADFYSKLAQRG